MSLRAPRSSPTLDKQAPAPIFALSGRLLVANLGLDLAEIPASHAMSMPAESLPPSAPSSLAHQPRLWLIGSLLICLGGAAAIGFFLRHAQQKRSIFPGKHWTLRTPEEVGMDSARLTWISKTLQGSGCIVRGGEIVHSWGQPTIRSNVWSASKPVVVHAVYKALEQGKIPNLDQPVVDV